MKWKEYLPLSILGISFWFFIGFPFENYHESYEWIAHFNTNSLSDFVFQTIGHYSSYRPLGQVIAILLYKLFNDSIIPIQLFNYSIVALSFFILTSTIGERKSLAVVLTIVGGIFFIGFSFLFHLHGLYYSPLLLLISFLIYFYNKSFSLQNLSIVFIIALIISLFHPFAIFIFIFFMVGLYIENRKFLSSKYFIVGFAFIIAGLAVVYLLVPNQTIHWEIFQTNEFLNVYKSLSKNLIMSAVSVLLSILTIRSRNININLKNYFSLGVILLSVLFYFITVPVILIWFLSSIIKSSILKKWALVFLILATFIFPVFTGIESRHLYFLIIVVCAYILPLNWEWLESKLNFIDGKKTVLLLTIVLSLFVVIKQDIQLPIISKIVRPLLVEKEKTYQLEEIITWLMKSEYKEYDINFVTENCNESRTKDLAGNSQRFPTTNSYINNYLSSLRSITKQEDNHKSLLVCFDKCKIEKAELIYSVEGNYAGRASLYVPVDKSLNENYFH